MSITLATTDAELLACLPVLLELRPHLAEQDFLARIRAQQAASYRVAYARKDGQIVTVAGFRIGESLSWGRYLYLDDLVTTAAHRSLGQGARMLEWLRARAHEEGCVQLHLDSGLQRTDAHRFYRREDLPAVGYHFAEDLTASRIPDKETAPQPPYYAVIFASHRRDGDNGYAAMAARMVALAQQQPGFIGSESARDTNLGITVSYWRDLASIAAWKANAEHREAQRLGKEIWYHDFSIRIARVEREWHFSLAERRPDRAAD